MLNRISDTGLSVVYRPEKCSPIVDIVFVHGLQGHPYKTWTYQPKSLKGPKPPGAKSGRKRKRDAIRGIVLRSTRKNSRPSPGNDAEMATFTPSQKNDGQVGSVFWPVDLISKECPNSRILMFGYDSKVTKYSRGAINWNSILSHSKDLLFALLRERRSNRPLVFVAHSLGGVVVKQMLAESSWPLGSHYTDIVESTAAVIFLGTPHRGSQDVANFGEVVRSFVSSLGMETTPVILDALRMKTTDLERAQEGFSKVWQKYDFKVKTFQEGLSLPKLRRKVVPGFSSLIGDHREHAETLQANHLEMCRFSGPDDPNYRKVSGELCSVYHSITRLKAVDALTSRQMRQRHGSEMSAVSLQGPPPTVSDSQAHDACLKSLWFPAIYARLQNVGSPAPQTCSWLFEHKSYQDWFNGKSRHETHGLLWLKGKPGAGKSTLMKEAFRRAALGQVESDYSTAAFFFHANGEELEHSSLGLFKSLLYQILTRDKQSLQRFHRFGDERWKFERRIGLQAPSWTEPDLKSFFESLAVSQTKKTFIFIDALDECDPSSIRSVAYFWRTITTCAYEAGFDLNVCVSGRHFPTITLTDCPEVIVDQHNGDDITRYVDQKLDVCMSAQRSQWEVLRRTILDKAAGVFLWAVLVVEDVLKHWDNGSEVPYLTTRVMNVPEELETLFFNMLSDLEPETKQLMVRFFQWAILATKPLRLYEWHHIMAFIRQPASGPLGELYHLFQERSNASPDLRRAFGSLREWRKSAHFTESDEQLEKQIRSLSRGLVEVKKVWTVDPQEGGVEVLSTHAGAGSLNFEQGDTRLVQVIHESVRHFFMRGNGFAMLDPSLRPNQIGNGHLSIMATCLDYIHIKELDALVEARILAGTLESRWKVQAANPIGTSLQRGMPGEEIRVQNWPPGKREEEIPVFEMLKSLSYAPGIDTVQWLDDHLCARRTGLEESPWESVADSSDASQLQMLEDDPALLSYATFELFTHAELAEQEGVDPGPLIARFIDGKSWTRWIALREDIPMKTTMGSYAEKMGLKTWLLHLGEHHIPPAASPVPLGGTTGGQPVEHEDDDSASMRSASDVASFSSAGSYIASRPRRHSWRSKSVY
ncbi:hypothetical protein J3F83DRAFT_295651 [Trichoderma novae-zelandiae]